jgi:hypothetical protein
MWFIGKSIKIILHDVVSTAEVTQYRIKIEIWKFRNVHTVYLVQIALILLGMWKFYDSTHNSDVYRLLSSGLLL